MTSLSKIGEALKKVGVPVSRYFAIKQPKQYIVWGEDSQGGSAWSNNKMTEQAIEGTVHYFTKKENDLNCVAIQRALSGIDLSYRLNSVQYEKDTKYIHYEWVWDMWLD